MEPTKVLDVFNYIPAEIVGIVYGAALEAGEIRKEQEVMEKAYGLGNKLASATGDMSKTSHAS